MASACEAARADPTRLDFRLPESPNTLSERITFMSPSRRTRSWPRPVLYRRATLILCLALAASFAYMLAQRPAAASRTSAQFKQTAPDKQTTAENKQTASPDTAHEPQSKARPFMPGEILVRFRGETKAADAEAAVASLPAVRGGEIPVEFESARGLEIVRGLRLARVPAAETESALAALRARPDVLYAEPNYVRRKLSVPNDPRYAEQWSLKNANRFGGGDGADIDAEQAWDITKGDRSVVVGIVDEGIDINHTDLQPNVWANTGEVPGNGIDDDGNGYVDDVHGWDFFHNDASVYDGAPGEVGIDATDAHGTHVAGIVGATGNNAIGVAGINWQVGLMPLKILGTESESQAPSSVLLTVRAYAYAKAMRDLYVSSGGTKGANVRVLNNSYGGIGRSQAELDAIHALNDSGILFVVAAGNDNTSNDQSPVYPANYDSPNVITVAATDQTDVLANFSNYGRTTVHMSAPGVGILSTTPGNTYDFASGTSMASPHVAGVAALLCAKRPEITVARLRSALLLSGEFTSFLGFNTVTGRRLNAQFALQNLDDADTTPPAAPSNLRADGSDIRWNAPGDDGVSGRATLYEIRFSDNDLTNPAEFARSLVVAAPQPSNALTPEEMLFNGFYGHSSGYIGIRAIDEVGNAGPVAQVHVAFNDLALNPYAVNEGMPASLSTGGTPLGLVGDDKYKTFTLPFNFPFYGFNLSSVIVSTNGAIYPVTSLYPPVVRPDGSGDFFSSVGYLTASHMIAVAWDDLRTDRRAGDDVYVVQPDADRVIFRWQAVTFDTPFANGTTRGEHPVNFEAELRRDGTIVTRYGDGNQSLLPVVGISNGVRDAYVSASHTSEEAFKDLTNAPAVTFERRKPDNSPYADLRLLSMTTDANPASTGERLTYTIFLVNYGTLQPDVVVTDPLPPGTNFVSCSPPPFIGATCSGPAPGANGAVTFNLPAYRSGLTDTLSVTVDVAAPAGSTLTNTASASSTARDPDTSNNSASVTTDVVSNNVFLNARAVAARGYYTLALKGDGTVWGWGENKSGQIYDGTKDESKIYPSQVSGLSGATAIAAGANFGLALKGDGTVWGWGDNTSGQLGNADVPAAPKVAPVQVKGLAGVTAIAAGAAHGLALKADGTLWAWGSNAGGQLGTGARDENPHFMPLFVMSDVTALAAGPGQTYAVKSDGTVWVCGNNFYGMAGQPNTIFVVPTPTQMQGLAGVRSVASSENSAFAIKSDGTLWAWGDNSYGQLGTGARNNDGNPAPAQVPGLSGVVSVTAGYTYVYAAKADGTLWGWGNNAFTPAVFAPTQVAGIAGVTQVAAGTTHAVALLGNGTVRTWGANDQGELGDGTNAYRNTWVAVTGLTRVTTPTITPETGTFYPAVDVTVNCATPGAVMHYTVNSFQDPTESDPIIAAGTTLHFTANPSRVRVRAWKNGMPASATKEGYYSIFDAGSFPPMPNPIDNSSNFVGQHYKDFLSRDADSSGQQFWTNEVESCGANAQCREVKRVNVSAAFFLSIEFQETGYFVYRLEKASFNRLPRFGQFMADTRQAAAGVVVNTPGWEQKLAGNKRAFAELWVRRADFKALYDGTSNAEYVDALYANAGVVPASNERDALVAGLGGGTETRASVLGKVADGAALRQKEKNRAFVLMQYFGYLRRNPDDAPDSDFTGYNFWLSKLVQFDGDFARAEMVKAFVSSIEYRKRFGQP
jgi:uncharacterized repeat protein (TIGR01451 family)